jgi:Domain of unknown function (DUF4157)
MEKQPVQKKAIAKPTSSSEIPTRPFAAPKVASSDVQPRSSYNLLDKPLFPIQAKLTIGQPNDQYEQEADRVAHQVVNQIRIQPIQRQEIAEDEEVRMKPIVQRQSDTNSAATPELETSIQRLRGNGQNLSSSIREPMEQAFGADFSGVKVHTNVQSDQMNRSIQAKAFTTGKDIFFRQGAYNPGNLEGQKLLAHELTHVIQQGGGTAHTMQRKPENATVLKTKSGVHKSNQKKVATNEADVLEVRSGGLLGTGIKDRLEKGDIVMVDFEQQSADGKYVWVQYQDKKGETKVGYVKRTYVETFAEVDAKADMKLASSLLDGYLNTHVIGQHLTEEVTNKDQLVSQGMTKAKNAESYVLGELGVSDMKGKAASTNIEEREKLKSERRKELYKKTEEELINCLIELVPTEEANRQEYAYSEKFDLVNNILKVLDEKDQGIGAKALDLQEEVWSRPEFWLTKGKDLLDEPMEQIQGGSDEGKIPIWCDQSTAIIIATLQDQDDFKSSLEVIKQGDPKQHGHWYVLANRDPGSPPPNFGQPLKGNEFIIDIWGTLRLNEYRRKEGKPLLKSVVHQADEPALLNTAVDEDRSDEQNALKVMSRVN